MYSGENFISFVSSQRKNDKRDRIREVAIMADMDGKRSKFQRQQKQGGLLFLVLFHDLPRGRRVVFRDRHQFVPQTRNPSNWQRVQGVQNRHTAAFSTVITTEEKRVEELLCPLSWSVHYSTTSLVMVTLSPSCCCAQARFLGMETKIFLWWYIQHYKICCVFKALHLFLNEYVAEIQLF